MGKGRFYPKRQTAVSHKGGPGGTAIEQCSGSAGSEMEGVLCFQGISSEGRNQVEKMTSRDVGGFKSANAVCHHTFGEKRKRMERRPRMGKIRKPGDASRSPEERLEIKGSKEGGGGRKKFLRETASSFVSE